MYFSLACTWNGFRSLAALLVLSCTVVLLTNPHFFYFRAFNMIDVNNEGITISKLAKVAPELLPLTHDPVLENRLHIEATYESFASEQAVEVEEVRKEESLIIPKDIDYHAETLNLNAEEREKLCTIQPQTVIFLSVYYK